MDETTRKAQQAANDIRRQCMNAGSPFNFDRAVEIVREAIGEQPRHFAVGCNECGQMRERITTAERKLQDVAGDVRDLADRLTWTPEMEDVTDELHRRAAEIDEAIAEMAGNAKAGA